MTPAEFRVTREYCGLSQEWLAARLNVSRQTVAHWEKGKYSIPDGVAQELIELAALSDAEVARCIGELRGKAGAQVVTFRSDNDVADALGLTDAQRQFPASWHRLVAARVSIATGAPVEYA